MKLKDVTGTPDAPICPRHSELVGLRPVKRFRGPSKEVSGYWQCPVCHHVFIPDQPFSPQL